MNREINPGEIEQPIDDFEDLPEGDGVLILSRQGRLLASNLQAERILRARFDRGQVIRAEHLFSPQHLPQAELAIREALQAGHSRSNLVATVRLESGLPVSVTYSVAPLYDENDRINGLLLTFREFGHMQATPKSSIYYGDVEIDALFENLAEGVFSINNRWRITSFNQRAQEITGFKREEVLGRFCWDIFRSDLCHTDCPLRATLETGVTRLDQDVRIVNKRSNPLTILVNTSVLKDRQDNVVGAVETFRPLTNNMPQGQSVSFDGAATRPDDIIGESPALVRLLNLLPDVAVSEASVVLEGESGTGKELLAKAIHAQGPRAGGPFVAVNTSALAETLLESELFGHEKAAFTGAVSSKVGRLEMARGGTLFLDEIAEIKPDIQVKLLRVLEEKVFERVGGTRPIPMNARIISATNRNLIEEVRSGRFREDLYYRLHTVPLYLPPLRERIQDIPLLVNHIIQQLNQKYVKNVRGIDPKVMSRFQRHHWPGNIRELQRVLEHAFVFVKGPVITSQHLPELESKPQDKSTATAGRDRPILLEDERQAIVKALERAGGRRQEAARNLGISRSSLWRKMKSYQLL